MTAQVGHHHHAVDPKDLTSVEAHLADILDSIRPLPPTQLGITEAEGCVLAEDIVASRPLPPFDNSAMDGYALIAADIASASTDDPVTLRVSGEVAAGDTGAYAVTHGSCLRITTGAKLPGRGRRGGARRGHRRRDRPGGDPRGGGAGPRGPVQRR